MNFSYLVCGSLSGRCPASLSLLTFYFTQHRCASLVPLQFNLYHNVRQIDPRTISLSLAHSAKEASQQKASDATPEGPLVKCE